MFVTKTGNLFCPLFVLPVGVLPGIWDYYQCVLFAQERCVFSTIWKNYVIFYSWVFYGENMVNVVTRMVCMEIEWRQGREWYFPWKFYGKISLEIFWDFHGENMVNQITRQSSYQFYHKIPIKGITLHTVSILSTQLLHITEMKYFFSVIKSGPLYLKISLPFL